MSFLCRLGMHNWTDCKCAACGKKRDKQHKWDGCKCIACGEKRDEQHKWDNGRCVRCNKECEHSWLSCVCTTCRTARWVEDEQHDWKTTSDGRECSRCGVSGGELKLHRSVGNWLSALSMPGMALRSKDAHLRREAVMRLTDQTVLAKIVVEDESPDVRRAAKDRLEELHNGSSP